MSCIYMKNQSLAQVNIGICSFMEGVEEVLENVPDPISEVEGKGIEIMDFRDGMDVGLL